MDDKTHFKYEYVQLVPSVSNAENVLNICKFPPVGHLAVTLSNRRSDRETFVILERLLKLNALTMQITYLHVLGLTITLAIYALMNICILNFFNNEAIKNKFISEQ